MNYLKNKIAVFLYFFVISLPLIICTFDTVNWSDDFQLPNLFALKAKFSPFFIQIFSTYKRDDVPRIGEHFAPVQNLSYYLVTLSYDPRVFHLFVVLCFILTAFFIFLLVKKYYKDEFLALIAGSLFAVNYYIGFKALSWNGFHSPCTNTLTGVISLYFLICYLEDRKPGQFIGSCVFFLLTVFNSESGFVFFPALIVFIFISFLRKQIQIKQLAVLVLIFSFLMSLYPAATYVRSEKVMPMAVRFQYVRNVQNYLFHAQQLLIDSTGMTIFYNKMLINPLRTDPQVKEPMVRLIKENDGSAFHQIPGRYKIFLGAVGLIALITVIFIIKIIVTRTRTRTWPFIGMYAALFLAYIFIYYRVDIANAIAVFSSIIIADCLVSFLRSSQKVPRQGAIALLALYIVALGWTAADGFEDCYARAYAGVSRETIKGPTRIYDEANRKIGHYIANGIFFFKHDYSPYHRTTGFERIGDMVGVGDLVSWNIVAFEKEFLKSNFPQEYREMSVVEFGIKIVESPLNQTVVVNSQQDALDYLKKHRVDLTKFEAIYMTKDYKIVNLKNIVGSSI